MNLSIIGAGNIGLVTSLCFSASGAKTMCVDNSHNKILNLREGRTTFYEPELLPLLREQLRQKNITFSTELKEALRFSDILFICIGTPNDTDGQVEMSGLTELVQQIAYLSESPKTIILRSTVPVGTNEKLSRLHKNLKFISSPEFLCEGTAILNCRNPERVVIGSRHSADIELFKKIYSGFRLRDDQFLFMDPNSAELSKYAANVFLAARISLINEFSRICETSGANIKDIQRVLSQDPRIGPHFLNAGLGYGGSCFPKDIAALSSSAAQLEDNLHMTRAIETTNALQIARFESKITSRLQTHSEKTLTIWGLSFKPETDDLREAPSLKLSEQLLRAGFRLNLYDPKAGLMLNGIYGKNPKVQILSSAEDALEDADALIICTEWPEFVNYDLKKLKSLMKSPIIFDGRNIYDPATMKALGFEYHSIGRPS